MLIRGVFTQRIPLTHIRSIAVPSPHDRAEWDQYVSASERWWGHGYIRSSSSSVLLVVTEHNRIAIHFSDPAPVYFDLQSRLDALAARGRQPVREVLR